MTCRGGDLDDLVTILLVASLPGGETTSYLSGGPIEITGGGGG